MQPSRNTIQKKLVHEALLRLNYPEELVKDIMAGNMERAFQKVLI